MDRLEHLRKQCGPHVSAAAKDSVEGICSKIYHISLEYVKRIREKHLALLKEHNISGRKDREVGKSMGTQSQAVGSKSPLSPGSFMGGSGAVTFSQLRRRRQRQGQNPPT
nr:mRNA (2'-O-methyladenosine-N(6)-)-methyltransferase-like [Anolis sagrei ordinatus]